MLVAFSVAPAGGHSSDSVHDAVAAAVRVVRDSGLPHRTDAMFTTIEGDWDECMAVVRGAVDAVEAYGTRVSLVLKADIRPGHSGELTGKLDRLEAAIARQEQGEHGMHAGSSEPGGLTSDAAAEWALGEGHGGAAAGTLAGIGAAGAMAGTGPGVEGSDEASRAALAASQPDEDAVDHSAADAEGHFDDSQRADGAGAGDAEHIEVGGDPGPLGTESVTSDSPEGAHGAAGDTGSSKVQAGDGETQPADHQGSAAPAGNDDDEQDPRLDLEGAAAAGYAAAVSYPEADDAVAAHQEPGKDAAESRRPTVLARFVAGDPIVTVRGKGDDDLPIRCAHAARVMVADAAPPEELGLVELSRATLRTEGFLTIGYGAEESWRGDTGDTAPVVVWADEIDAPAGVWVEITR